MLHPNPFISAFLNVPEWYWKNVLRRWLAFSRVVPNFIQDFSPLKGYERIHTLQPGDTVVDAGAYPGDYTLFAARKVGPEGRIFALEPDPANRKLLEKHVRRSGFTNIEIIPFGLWDSDADLFLDASGVASTLSEQDSPSPIPVRALDDLMSEWGLESIDVLKMDIEGAEIQALKGAEGTLKTCRYVCVASYHILDGTTTASRVEELLQAAGLSAETGYPKHLTTTGLR